MSNTTIEIDQPAAAAPSEPPTQQKKTTKTVNKAQAGKKTAKKSKATVGRKSATKPTGQRPNKKAEVIALMKRAKGATLEEVMASTGWQRHTVRGFVSILGSKGGEKIESSKNTAGERTYRIVK